MTDKQDIRAKSAELAIRLLDIARAEAGVDPKRSLLPRSMITKEAQEYFDSVINLARQFEAFILDVPENT
jgi:hypothetical protein